MSNHFERYSCQMALPGFGESSQKALQKARVLIVGVGGLGCPAAQYLTSAGIGTIGLADDDVVSFSNLHRQILFSPSDVELPKVEAAAGRLRQQNPSAQIISHRERVTSANVMDLIGDYDLVIEGTDNFETKFLLNDACVLSGKALVFGAIYQYDGQVAVWNVKQKDGAYSPNYRDVFPEAETALVPNCSDGGVIPTLAGIVGCMQAGEAIKYLTGSKDLLAGKLWMINMLDGKTRIIRFKKNPEIKIERLKESIPCMTWPQLQEKIKTDNVDMLDVRSTSEHRVFNIGGTNIPLDELDHSLDKLSFSDTVLCYCATGKRSVAAARIIKNKFPQTKVYSLQGGLNSYWEDEHW